MTHFTARCFNQSFRPRQEYREFIDQCYRIGYQALPLINVTGFIMGLVRTMQLQPTLVNYGVEA